MKKRIVSIVLLLMCLLLCSCEHNHTWEAATCISPKICPDCGETEGEALGHGWVNATCTSAKYCSVCLEEVGSPLGHVWHQASCTQSKYCSVCKLTEGVALGHAWQSATCVDPETCSVCHEQQGSPLGHTVGNWEVVVPSSCTSAGIESAPCTVCGEQIDREIAILDHVPGDWSVSVQPTASADGIRVKCCTVCGRQVAQETFTLSAEEIELQYKNSCQSISYDQLSRSPQEYEGDHVVFSGRVVQVCSEAQSILYYSTYRVATSGNYDDVVYIYVDNYGSGSRILEDDWVTFYGEFDGLYTYSTVLGASITIPCVKVQYIE